MFRFRILLAVRFLFRYGSSVQSFRSLTNWPREKIQRASLRENILFAAIRWSTYWNIWQMRSVFRRNKNYCFYFIFFYGYSIWLYFIRVPFQSARCYSRKRLITLRFFFLFYPVMRGEVFTSHKRGRVGRVKTRIIRLYIRKSYAHEKCLMCRKKGDTRMNSPGI